MDFDLNSEGLWLWIGAAVAALIAVVLLIGVILNWLRRRAARPFKSQSELTVDVTALPTHGPQATGPRLTFYGTPVRLAVLVLAPVGREGELPPTSQLPQLIEQVVPNSQPVLARDKPLIRHWPAQLSSQGFLSSFFHHLALPGDRGKNTPWCSVGGKFTAEGSQFLVGMVCCADRPNGLSQAIVEHEGRWLEVVRVRTDDAGS